MKNMTRYACTLIVSIGVGGTSAVLAQSWSINSGRNVGTLLPSESRKLQDGSMYITGGSKVVVETEDQTYPITGQTMDCRWVCSLRPNSQDGSCVNLCGGVDKDGDLFSFVGVGGFATGHYQVGPGTGKYEKAKGGGSYEVVPTSDPTLTLTRFKGTLQTR